MNPVRGDRLTVREVARLQGFDDDFVFYHTMSAQYVDVFNGIPPIIPRRIGHIIRRVIQISLGIRVASAPNRRQRPNKRVRVDDEA
jgi:site-specific DNA-cytosine methylase